MSAQWEQSGRFQKEAFNLNVECASCESFKDRIDNDGQQRNKHKSHTRHCQLPIADL